MRHPIVAAVAAGLILAVLAWATPTIARTLTDGTLVGWLGGVPASSDRAPVNRGYGDGAHRHGVTTADCPDRMYVGGIRVHYGGTCRNECDADGGSIRNIELVCKPL